jgi:hypothetical protein
MKNGENDTIFNIQLEQEVAYIEDCTIDGFVKSPSAVRHAHSPEQSRRAALYYIPCPVKLKAAISKDMGYRRCLKTVTSNKENI